MTMQYRGHDVVDPNHKLVGTINDVLYDAEGEPTWAVVDVGLLRASHYVPVSVGYTADDGTFVVPFDKQVVTVGSQGRSFAHAWTRSTESELVRYYELTTEATATDAPTPRRRRCVERHARVGELFKYFLVLTDVLNSVGTIRVSRTTRAPESGATMTTILMDQLNTGDVIEMKTPDNDVITVLVLLATDDALVLDPCNGETPFVLRADELIEYRKFDAEAMFADS